MTPLLPNSVPPPEYATKQDLRELRLEIQADLLALENRLQKTIITTLIAMTAIFGTLVTVLKLFA